MNASCAPAPPEVNEFALAGLTPTPSTIVGVPRVAESPVAFECRCSQIIRLNNAAGAPTDGWLIMGEVVGVRIARTLLRDGVHAGGGPADYFEISRDSLFRMQRPDYLKADQ